MAFDCYPRGNVVSETDVSDRRTRSLVMPQFYHGQRMLERLRRVRKGSEKEALQFPERDGF